MLKLGDDSMPAHRRWSTEREKMCDKPSTSQKQKPESPEKVFNYGHTVGSGTETMSTTVMQ
jgi:hypothetical protein